VASEMFEGLSRRGLIAAAAAVTGGTALAQSAPATREKGPLVWLNMDQKELDDAYDQAVYAPNAVQLHKRRQEKCKEVRARLGEPRRVAYGSTPVEMLDIYTTKRPNAPINVFIHGGAWRSGESWEFCDAAELFVHAGAHFIVPDFIDVIKAGGSLMPMAEQVRRSIAWVHKNAASFGGDPSRVYVSGRSSGAHLAGTALITDWPKDFGVPADVIKGALLSSGMYDLKPVRLSKRGAYVKFTDEMEEALSTQRHLARINCPVIVAHGTYETPEFQRQARDFAAALKAAGKPVTLLIGEGYNHFEMPETLGNPYGLLGRAVLEQMKLTSQS
jgi:arylformamidase